MLVDSVVFASERAFTVSEHEMRSMMAQIANNGRKIYKTGVSSAYALRSFGFRNRPLNMRRTKRIVLKRNSAQNTEHFKDIRRHSFESFKACKRPNEPKNAS